MLLMNRGMGLERYRESAFLIGALALLPLLTSCGGDSSSPTSPAAGAGTGSVVISGQVVGTVHSRPISGARVELGGAAATTDGSGNFELRTSSNGVFRVTVSGPNHVTRHTFLRSDGPRPVIDIIEEDVLWHLDFYRELARDGSGGRDLRPLNPWAVEPYFYVDRRPESGTNRSIPDSAVDTVVEAIRTVLPLLTQNKLQGNQIEIGIEPPADSSPGTVVIRWDPVEVAEVAGPAAGFTRGVGGDASVVVLRTVEDTEAVFHELGHVLGLYHPLSGFRPSLMLGTGNPRRPHFTDWDIFHTNILYARPTGNTDIDDDPPGFVINAGSQ